MKEQRQFEKFVAAYKKKKGIQAEDKLALILAEAERNLAAGEKLDPRVITLVRAVDEEAGQGELDMAAGADGPIDWTTALERLEAVKQS